MLERVEGHVERWEGGAHEGASDDGGGDERAQCGLLRRQRQLRVARRAHRGTRILLGQVGNSSAFSCWRRPHAMPILAHRTESAHTPPAPSATRSRPPVPSRSRRRGWGSRARRSSRPPPARAKVAAVRAHRPEHIDEFRRKRAPFLAPSTPHDGSETDAAAARAGRRPSVARRSPVGAGAVLPKRLRGGVRVGQGRRAVRVWAAAGGWRPRAVFRN